MNLHTLNPWAILVAAVSSFVLGGIWYGAAVWRGVEAREWIYGRTACGEHGEGLRHQLRSEPGDVVQPCDVSERSEDDGSVGSYGWVSGGLRLGDDGAGDCVAF